MRNCCKPLFSLFVPPGRAVPSAIRKHCLVHYYCALKSRLVTFPNNKDPQSDYTVRLFSNPSMQ